ncbi:MAG: acyl-CoA dehydrogenase family protein [Roseicyclus sp.]
MAATQGAPDWNAMAEADFRAHLRAVIAAHCPEALRHLPHRLPAAQTQGWYQALHAAGMIAPAWPVEWGGMDLSPARHLIYIEEMEAAGTPFLHDSGVRNLAPALLAHGTQAQKARYLPPMHAGKHIWCQGYSEPGAGSDLASLGCEGRVEGDKVIVTGQKIWTTSATEATHIFALVRTDRAGPKQHGISFLLVDMATPGITVRPITTLSGQADFCEVFFDGVQVAMADVVGGLHEGWKVARSLLGFERIWAGSPKRAVRALDQLGRLLAERGLEGDPIWADRYGRAYCDTRDAQDLYARFADLVAEGGDPGAEVSALKIWSTATYQTVSEALVEAAGEDGGLLGSVPAGTTPVDVLATYHEARAPTIFAGTNEIHRNILARAVLGLPKAP